MKTRLDGVQYLRGISALIVVISHCNGILGKPEYYSRMAIPDLHVASVFAVALFFSISGFIIVVASLNGKGTSASSRREFWTAENRANHSVPVALYSRI